MYVEPLSPIERGTFKIQDDSELPNKGPCFRYMVNRNYQIRGVLRTYGSRYQMRGACLRYKMSRYRQLRGACSRYRMTRNHQVFLGFRPVRAQRFGPVLTGRYGPHEALRVLCLPGAFLHKNQHQKQKTNTKKNKRTNTKTTQKPKKKKFGALCNYAYL